MNQNPTRRIVFQGALGCAALALAGCGSTDSASSSNPSDSGSSSGSASSAGKKVSLGATADIPVGGGVVFVDEKVVVTQPVAGTFHGFSAICTHQGFVVTKVASDTITCEHHGSQFSADDGSVKNGPATSPLPSVTVKVEGDQLFAVL